MGSIFSILRRQGFFFLHLSSEHKRLALGSGAATPLTCKNGEMLKRVERCRHPFSCHQVLRGCFFCFFGFLGRTTAVGRSLVLDIHSGPGGMFPMIFLCIMQWLSTPRSYGGSVWCSAVVWVPSAALGLRQWHGYGWRSSPWTISGNRDTHW